MALLGHTLGVTLRIVRPSLYGKQDYVSVYTNFLSAPKVNLIAEDDRHYNVIVE